MEYTERVLCGTGEAELDPNIVSEEAGKLYSELQVTAAPFQFSFKQKNNNNNNNNRAQPIFLRDLRGFHQRGIIWFQAA